MKVNSDFRDLLSALNEAEAQYMVIGGYAVGYYAEPRFTKDLDIWFSADGDNPERIYSALARFGAPLSDLTVDDLATDGLVFQLGMPPNRIDVLNQISGGIEFQAAWSAKIVADFGGVTVNLIGIDDLIKNKIAAARPQDVRDVRTLERARTKLAR
jgi:predicted nucleotidyltransferase